MPKRVMDLFSCWYGSVGRHSVIWKAIPHCIMWCLWRERNARIFEDCELSVVEIKLHFYRSLLDWMSVTGLFRLSNMLDLIDNCSFWAGCILSPCAQLVCLVFSIKFIIYQKKKNDRGPDTVERAKCAHRLGFIFGWAGFFGFVVWAELGLSRLLC